MAELPTGSLLAGCRIEGLVGRGGMGVVYRATQLSLERPVALKVIAPDFAGDITFRERFKRESRIAASIEHPNVIPVYEAGEGEGQLYLIMRFVEGTDLRAVIDGEGGGLSPERAAQLVAQVAAGLAAAHRRDLIHRDVKPANVLIDAGGEREHAYLTDFGIARHSSATSGLTHTGALIGTMDYLAPERIQDQGGDGRADVYALGCVLFEALTGARPYERDNDVAKMYAHLSAPVPSARELRPDLPPELDELAQRAMAKDPDDRFASAGEMSEALTDTLPSRPITAPSPPLPPTEPAGPAEAAEPAPSAPGTEPAARCSGGGRGRGARGHRGRPGGGGHPPGAAPTRQSGSGRARRRHSTARPAGHSASRRGLPAHRAWAHSRRAGAGGRAAGHPATRRSRHAATYRSRRAAQAQGAGGGHRRGAGRRGRRGDRARARGRRRRPRGRDGHERPAGHDGRPDHPGHHRGGRAAGLSPDGQHLGAGRRRRRHGGGRGGGLAGGQEQRPGHPDRRERQAGRHSDRRGRRARLGGGGLRLGVGEQHERRHGVAHRPRVHDAGGRDPGRRGAGGHRGVGRGDLGGQLRGRQRHAHLAQGRPRADRAGGRRPGAAGGGRRRRHLGHAGGGEQGGGARSRDRHADRQARSR